MKGYSFDELVKLAMAAVKRAGDTMTGNLTTPKVLVSEAQGTESNALTRKDYVDNQLSRKLSTSGGTITGPLRVEANPGAAKLIFADDTGSDLAILHDDSYTAFREGEQGVDLLALTGGGTPTVTMRNPRAAQAQEQLPQSLTRKDYVDTELSRKLSLTGGKVTGPITSLATDNFRIASGSIGTFWRKDDTQLYLMLTAAGDPEGGYNNLRPFHVSLTDGSVFIDTRLILPAGQAPQADAATRKDYVDGQVATRAPMAHTHTVAAITDLRPQDANATANTLALRDSEADVHARLLRTTFVDESYITGAIAFRVNNSGDNYTRYCNNPAAVREWMRYAKTPWNMEWRAYIEHPYTPMTEYHIPGKAAVITYLATDNGYRITSSDGAGGGGFERLRIDSSGNLFATAAIYEAGQRVYSPNNPPHYTHNHTAAQGNSDIVAGGYGQIGTYGLFYNLGTEAPVGTQRSGSTLRWSGARNNSTANVNPSGTWKCVGHAKPNGYAEGEAVTLWIRVA